MRRIRTPDTRDRRARPVSSRQVLGGLAAIVASVALLVGLCSWLLLPVEAVEELPAPADGSAEVAAGLPDCPRQLVIDETPEPHDVPASLLIDCPDLFDGRGVVYEGEAVGAVLDRGQRLWTQLNDDIYARAIGPLPQHRTTAGGNSGIAVSLPSTLRGRLTVGSFRTHGTVVRVVGTFRRADPNDGGAPTITAQEAVVVADARPVVHRVSWRRVGVAVALSLLAAAAALGLLAQRRRR